MSDGASIGYARVSTGMQDLALQRDALDAAGCRVIYEETASGAKRDRPELAQCLKALRAGDELVVWKLDRLGRSMSHLVDVVMELEGRGVKFRSLTEGIDTGSAQGRLFYGVFAAFAQFERELINERSRAGLAAARARGRKGGRTHKHNAAERTRIALLMGLQETNVSELAKDKGVSRSTLYDYLREHRARCAASAPVDPTGSS